MSDYTFSPNIPVEGDYVEFPKFRISSHSIPEFMCRVVSISLEESKFSVSRWLEINLRTVPADYRVPEITLSFMVEMISTPQGVVVISPGIESVFHVFDGRVFDD